jgi:hypothetical protein
MRIRVKILVMEEFKRHFKQSRTRRNVLPVLRISFCSLSPDSELELVSILP